MVESVENRRVESVENVQNRRPSDVFLALARYRILGEQSGLEEFADLMQTWAEIVRLETEEARRTFLDRLRREDGGAKNRRRGQILRHEEAEGDQGDRGRAAAGKTMQDIADAAPGLTINQIMDAIAANPLPLPTWALIEKALKKLAKDGAAESGEKEADA